MYKITTGWRRSLTAQVVARDSTQIIATNTHDGTRAFSQYNTITPAELQDLSIEAYNERLQDYINYINTTVYRGVEVLKIAGARTDDGTAGQTI